MQNLMMNSGIKRLRASLTCSAVFSLAIVSAAHAQATSIGTVEVEASKTTTVSKDAVGSQAAPGSAPALAPSQGNLEASEPGSIVSDKIINDVIAPSGNYLNVVQYTPGAFSTTPDGAGDSKGGWRGFIDGQYDVTYDGVPFGDANDPSHHTGAYFPTPFIGRVDVDRGPGKADSVGYAPFGGTLSMFSHDVTDKFGGSVEQSVGNFNTFNTAITVNSGILNPSGTKFLAQYSHQNTDGTLYLGRDNSTFGLFKIVQPLEDFTVTGFATYGQQYYNQVGAITAAQLAQFGKNFGSLNNNPAQDNFFGYNNSIKQTDLDYIDIKGHLNEFEIENKVYTYAYSYPSVQNNGTDLTCLLSACLGTKQFGGVPAASAIDGYIKVNNYRGYGDILDVSHKIDAGMFSGNWKTGIWLEHVDNHREQQYYDYSTNQSYSQLGLPANQAYKLNLDSHITEVQPFMQYEWHPMDKLTITPGVKYESFERLHQGPVNQTTLAPVNLDKTYTSVLPYMDVRYKFTPEFTGYLQASQGFLAPPVAAYYVTNFAANNVKPQTSNNYQAGGVYKTGNLTADADIYWLDIQNFSNSVTDPISHLTYYANLGNGTYKGIEGEATYKVLDGLSVYGSGSISSAKVQGGLSAPDAPNYTAAFGPIYDHGDFFGSILTKFTGEAYGSAGQTLVTGVTSSLNKVPAYNETDLALGYRTDFFKQFGPIGKTEIKLGVNNVFNNRNTIEIGGTPNSLTSNSNLTYQFQPQRTWYVSMKAEF